MDTALTRLAATLDRLDDEDAREESNAVDVQRCVIPGCRYTAPTGLKCGYHTGADLRSRTAKPDFALRLGARPT